MITVTHKIFLYVPKIRVCNLLPFQEMITAIKGEFQWRVVWERLLKCGTKIWDKVKLNPGDSFLHSFTYIQPSLGAL